VVLQHDIENLCKNNINDSNVKPRLCTGKSDWLKKYSASLGVYQKYSEIAFVCKSNPETNEPSDTCKSLNKWNNYRTWGLTAIGLILLCGWLVLAQEPIKIKYKESG
jgi:hypothetical protein